MAGPIARSASSRWMSRPSTPLLHTVMAGRRHEACFAPPFTPHSTKSWPGFVPAIHVLLLHEPVEGRGYPGHRREAKLRRLARARRERSLLWLWVPAAAGTTMDLPQVAPNSSASTRTSRVRFTSGQQRLNSSTSVFRASPLMARSSAALSANSYMAWWSEGSLTLQNRQALLTPNAF